MARIVAIVVVAVLAATPAAAPALHAGPYLAATQNQLQDVPAPAPAPAPAPRPQDTALSGGQKLLVALGIVALIGAIWFVISRDARRATAGRVRGESLGGEPRSAGSRAARRSRKLSAAERQRRKRGRAR